MPARLPSRLRQSHLPPSDPPDPPDPTELPTKYHHHHQLTNEYSDLDPEDEPQAPSSKKTSSQQEETFTLQIMPSNPIDITAPPNQDSLPALLGLDTLSLSLPSSSSSSSSRQSDLKSKVKQVQPISCISISNIPCDRIHLLFSSPKIDTGVRSGFWFSVGLGRNVVVVVVRWDSEKEEFGVVADAEEELVAVMEGKGVKKFDYARLLALKAGARTSASDRDQGTTGAKQDDDDDHLDEDEWTVLTQYINPEQLDQIIPPYPSSSSRSSIRTWPISTLSSTPSSDNDNLDQPSKEFPQEPTLNLTPISFSRTFPPTAIGSERTRWARDRSWYISSLAGSEQPFGERLLTEFSISFIQSMILGNYPSLAQWKAILALGLTCRSALTIESQTSFFISLLTTLRAEIQYLALDSANPSPDQETYSPEPHPPADTGSLFEITGSDGEELARLLRGFNSAIEETNALPSIRAAFDNLLKTVDKLDIAGWKSLATHHSYSTNAGRNGNGDRPDVDGGNISNSSHGLSRRLLRLREGFGDDFNGGDYTNDDNDENNEDEDDEEETGEFAPVVVDLDGSLGLDDEHHRNNDSNDNSSSNSGGERWRVTAA